MESANYFPTATAFAFLTNMDRLHGTNINTVERADLSRKHRGNYSRMEIYRNHDHQFIKT